ncbi:hypothetical protein DL766_007436 [Monosporascus sp. MC13-8B]|uniref:BTB domain transcription factor n=1 Tax=Monosporascus cannonballus TaxID=155416 RepID=A0ABY0HHG0_9PEZI|nr:hypothetical protein DL762_002617 [Monosporascus cannonballus]RYP01577.1 hypothetical protein DL763_000108 [Monosporascus cannonballus]RYP23780.1 hypothetical protein DL766_007436 [Monosporascus sp. MC13-8B]
MATTRSKKEDNSQASTTDQAAGAKHQIDHKTSPASKRTKKGEDDDMESSGDDKIPSPTEAYGPSGARESRPKDKDHAEGRQDTKDREQRSNNGSSAVKTGERPGAPSNILEKGIIYFFFRGRVGIDEPEGVDDIARSYIVLRPIEKDAKLGEGTIGDAGNSRLIAIPKKVLPQSGRERWIAFVEKTHTSFKTLKEEFLASKDYETKTAGTRHTPAATPVAEGVYAITTTGRESHLAYIITLPSRGLSKVQTEMGLREKGSFIISTRNPAYPPPGRQSLPGGPEYPKEIQDEFRSLRWIGTNPKHLDVVKTQFLLIGESSGIQKATEPQKKAEGNEEPIEELEKLEDEDTRRMEHLKGDDSASIYLDLEVHAKDYPKLQTTF